MNHNNKANTASVSSLGLRGKKRCVDENDAQQSMDKVFKNGSNALVCRKPNFIGQLPVVKEEVKKEPVKVLLKPDRFLFGGSSTYVSPSLAYDVDQYLRHLEEKLALPTDFLKGKSVDWKMRTILVDWLFHVQRRLELLPETICLAIYLLDCSLKALRNVNKENLQLLGVACLFISAKFEEVIFPIPQDLIYLSADLFKKEDLLNAEQKVMKACKFRFGVPYSIQFLRCFRFYLNPSKDVYNLAKCLSDLAKMIFELACKKPSIIAAASFHLAFIAFLHPFDKSTFDSLRVDYSDVVYVSEAMVEPAIKYLDQNEKRLCALHENHQLTLSRAQISRMRSHTKKV